MHLNLLNQRISFLEEDVAHILLLAFTHLLVCRLFEEGVLLTSLHNLILRIGANGRVKVRIDSLDLSTLVLFAQLA